MAEKQAVVVDGSSRVGKGVGTTSYENTYENVVTEEAGLGYRALTKGLYEGELIHPEQSEAEVSKALASVGISHYRDLAGQRDELVGQFGVAAFYEDKVNTLVPLVGREPVVRSVVKEAFKERIRRMIRSEEHDILVVDGRNLGPVIESVDGIEVAARMFVTCSAEEAARRECLRKKIDPRTSPDEYERIRQSIQARNERDANRPVDKVAPDEDAIDYWLDEELVEKAVRQWIGTQQFRQDAERVREMITSPHGYTRVQRLGAGTFAAMSGRQLLLDTSDFIQHGPEHSLPAMLGVMHTIFEEIVATTNIELIRSK